MRINNFIARSNAFFLLAFLSVFFVIASIFESRAQVGSQEYNMAVKEIYDKQKSEGKLDPLTIKRLTELSINAKTKPKISSKKSSNSAQSVPCDCWVERDNTFSIAPFTNGIAPEYRNDDGSTPSLNIPFTFCFYGDSHNAVFINNNGNISLEAPYATFTANSFPDPAFKMVAPFWGDVDTRLNANGMPQGGLVHYKITPTYMIVQWDSVDYFNAATGGHNSLYSSFQLIISNGLDAIIQNGNNVAFCYKDMQWTTGDASFGSGGFGGTPATVGANKGDGLNFIQFGRFDHEGIDYDGTGGAADGVSWLDDQLIVFNTCATGNLAPNISGISVCGLDTITACAGDTTLFSVSFFSPEVGQITTPNATSTTLTNFIVTSNTPENAPTVSISIIPVLGDVGYHTITFSGTDNGAPPQTTNADVVVHVIAPMPINAGVDQTICFGDSAQLNSVSAAISWQWSPVTGLNNPNIPNPKASPGVSTMYYVNGLDGVSVCSGTDSVLVVVNPAIANAGPDVTLCTGFTATLNACMFSGCSFSWAPAIGLSNPNVCSPLANPAVTTTYTLTMTSCIGGCVTTDVLTVFVVPSLPADAGPAQTTCSSDTVQMNATGGVNYNWNPSTGLNNAAIGNPRALPTGTTTYTVNMSDATGCSGSDTVSVTVIQSPTVNAGSDVSYCIGNSTTLNGSGNGTSFAWSPPGGLSSTSILNPVANPIVSTYYKLTMNSLNGCSNKDSVLITVNPLPTVAAGSDFSLCVGDTATIPATGSAGTYLWNPAAGLSASNILNPIANPTGTTTYTLTITDANNCVKSDAVLITINPLPSVTAGNDLTLCGGASGNFMAVGSGGAYSWAPPTGLSSTTVSNPSVTALVTTTYTVTLIDVNNCRRSDDIKLTVATSPQPIAANITDEKCGDLDGKIVVTSINGGVSPFSYSLNNSNNFVSSNSFSNLASGSYEIFVKDQYGCISSNLFTVAQYLGIEAIISADPISGSTPLTVNFTNASTGASSYLWNFGDSSSTETNYSTTHIYESGGFFFATMIASNSPACSDTATILISAIDLFAPNIFTPYDVDGLNDRFNVRTEGLSTVQVIVFNRWGKKIAEWDAVNDSWDGSTEGGSRAEAGVYYYIVNALALDGREYNQHGLVHLNGKN